MGVFRRGAIDCDIVMCFFEIMIIRMNGFTAAGRADDGDRELASAHFQIGTLKARAPGPSPVSKRDEISGGTTEQDGLLGLPAWFPLRHRLRSQWHTCFREFEVIGRLISGIQRSSLSILASRGNVGIHGDEGRLATTSTLNYYASVRKMLPSCFR